MKWKVYHETASYWEVGERIESSCPPPVEVGPGKVNYIQVCRVSKHANGIANLALILGAPEASEHIARIHTLLTGENSLGNVLENATLIYEWVRRKTQRAAAEVDEQFRRMEDR